MSNLHRKLLSKLCKPKDDDCHDDDHHHHELQPLQVLMICTLAAFFSLVCYIIIVKKCRALQARRHSRRISTTHGINTHEEAHQDFIDADHEPVVFHPVWLINTVGLDQSVIDSIEMFKYRKEDRLIDSDCSVCLGEFQEDESLRILPKCSHVFHVACIDTWLRSHKNCPVCRAPVVNNASIPQTDPNSVESSTQEEIPRNRITGVESAREIDTNGESLEKNSCTSGVRVQSDLTNQCCQKLEPTRRSVSIGSFRFVGCSRISSVTEAERGANSGGRKSSSLSQRIGLENI